MTAAPAHAATTPPTPPAPPAPPKGPNKVRKDPSKNQLAARGLVVLVVILLILALIRGWTQGSFGGPPKVSADLRNAGGSLVKGSDVKLNGVIIGRVLSISRAPSGGGVRVSMAMDKSLLDRVPANVVARILPATIFGTSYVDLKGTPDGAPLKAGAVVPADQAQGTLELQNALDDIDSLVNALDPKELATAIGAAAIALDGRGEALGNTAVSLDSYLKTLTPQVALLRSDLGKLADLMELIQKVAPNLLDGTDNSLIALKTLVAHKSDLNAVLVNATGLANKSNDFLKKNTDELNRFLKNAYALVDALYDNRGSFAAQVQVNKKLHAIVRSAIEQGFLHVDADVTTVIPGYYGSGDRPSFGGAQ